MIYNTSQKPLKLQEYGRKVQEMIEFLRTVDDKEERTRLAHSVVSVMGILNPSSKDNAEYRQKLWDHFYMMADYDIDVDSPYPMPPKPDMKERPMKPGYSSNHIKFRYYGKLTEKVINALRQQPDSPSRQAHVNALAGYMKMSYRMWNEDKVPDEVIVKAVQNLSLNELTPDSIRDSAPPADFNQSMRPKNSGQKKKTKKKKRIH